MIKVLIIDDDQAMCKMLSGLVNQMGHDAVCEHTLAAGLKEARSNPYDVVLLDVQMPDGSGLSILPQIRVSKSSPDVIIMTGAGSSDGAELAIDSGAWDYIQKTSSLQDLKLSLAQVLQYRQEKEANRPKIALKREGIIGNSPQMQACLDLMAQAASSHANVLITGETGTGKELFARAIHANSSRADKNWVVVDCAALPETLVESALFGYEKGAFTGAEKYQQGLFQQADGGTLFLDEVGELPLSVQKTFLRTLQEQHFRPVGSKREIYSDFRLIAATNQNLKHIYHTDAFRSDLFYRLKTIEIKVPPLHERREDLKELILYYMGKICEKNNLMLKGLSSECLAMLFGHSWPGNVRELVNALERAIVVSGTEPVIFPKHLPTDIRIRAARTSLQKAPAPLNNQEKLPPPPPSFEFPNFNEYKERMIAEGERKYLESLISFSKGSVKEASRISGLGRTWIYALMKKYGISRFGWPQ